MPRRRRKPGITNATLKRLKRAAIDYFIAQKEADRRLRILKAAIGPITIPLRYLR